MPDINGNGKEGSQVRHNVKPGQKYEWLFNRNNNKTKTVFSRTGQLGAHVKQLTTKIKT